MLCSRVRIARYQESAGLDFLVASTPENVYYTTGFWGLGHWLLRGTQVYSIVPRESTSRVTLIAPVGEMDIAAGGNVWADEIIPSGVYYYFQSDAELTQTDEKLIQLGIKKPRRENTTQGLLETLKGMDVHNVTIGVDEKNLPVTVYNRIQSELPAKIVPASTLFPEIRSVKTDEEVRRLRNAVKAAEQAIHSALRIAKEGVTEQQLAIEMAKTMIENGAKPQVLGVGFGSRGAYPNILPSERRLKGEDAIRFDIACTYECYWADISRMGFLGKPSDKHQRYYNSLLRGHEKALAQIRPGAKISDIFAEGMKGVREGGLSHYERSNIGHGIGLEVYDLPPITPSNHTPLEEGMALCVEFPYCEIGFGGLQVEDQLLVTEDGYELLSKSPRDIQVV